MVLSGKEGKKIPQRLCFINAAKICNSGQGSAFDRGRRGKKLIDFCSNSNHPAYELPAMQVYIYV
jgi:hypothetical protein